MTRLGWSALVLGGLLALTAPAAHATTIAIFDAGGIRTIDAAAGAPGAPITPRTDVVGLAYDGSGPLLATVPSSADTGICDVVDAASGATVADGAATIPQTERDAGVCEIATDPAGGLLFGASNLTAGSLSTYRLSLDGSVSSATYGYGASGASDGTVVSVQHRYWSAGGSYEQPWLTPPSGAARPLSRTPAPSGRDGRQFTAVAITRDATRVAAIALAGIHAPRAELLTAVASGRFSAVRWRLAPRRAFVGVQWLPDGSGLIVGVLRSPSARTFDLYRCDPDGKHRTRLAARVRGFAVGGDV